ncbi:DUF2505 domain-containing protein [Myxococcota bacterium]|nr:DUF2505 domain-containing protein [Myxococcota bacterium]
MQNFNKTMTVNMGAEKLLNLITDASFENEKNKRVNKSLDSQVKEIERTDSSFHFNVTTTDYERGITGVNKKKTEQTLYAYKWDLKTRSATWHMTHPMGSKVNINGTVKIIDKGERSELQNSMSIEIKIPLVGGKVEKMIVSEIESGWGAYEAIINEYAAK